MNNPVSFIDPYGLAPAWVGPTAAVLGATGGGLILTGNPVGTGLGLAAVAGGLTIWDWTTSIDEQSEAVINGEDMQNIKENLQNIQDTIDEMNNQNNNDYCPTK